MRNGLVATSSICRYVDVSVLGTETRTITRRTHRYSRLTHSVLSDRAVLRARPQPWFLRALLPNRSVIALRCSYRRCQSGRGDRARNRLLEDQIGRAHV